MPVITMVSDDYFYRPCRHHNWKRKWRRVNLWSCLWGYVSQLSDCANGEFPQRPSSWSDLTHIITWELLFISLKQKGLVFSQNLLALARADCFSENIFWPVTLSPSSYVPCLKLSSTSHLSLPKWGLMVTHCPLQTSNTPLWGQDPRNAEVD